MTEALCEGDLMGGLAASQARLLLLASVAASLLKPKLHRSGLLWTCWTRWTRAPKHISRIITK